MRQGRARWLTRLAFLTGVALWVLPVQAKEEARPLQITSFSGAYLAAHIAESDNDLDDAIAYYKQALAFAPNDKELQQSLMLALVAQGRFEESLVYADKLKEVPDVERFSRLALAIDSFHKKDYAKAQYWLKLSLESDLDRLLSGVMDGWAKEGAGNASEAMDSIDKLKGPDWFGLFKSFHRALIADAAGLNDKAEELYAATMADTAAGGSAPETWMRNAQAYASFLVRKGDKSKAQAVLNQAEAFAPGKLEITTLRDRISKGDKIEPLVAGPADGASEILLDLATALNRGGGEPFVRLYLQYALALKPDSDAALVQLAAVAEQLKDGEGAVSLYRRIPASSPLKELSDLQIGLNLADLDKHDEAVSHLKAYLDRHPDDMRAYLALGGVYGSKEDFRSAASLYDKAVDQLKTPTAANWNIFYQRGIAYERLKEWPKAEPNFRKALELQPDQPQVMNYLGYSWVDMNMNLKEGLAMIQKAVDLRPNDGYIVDSLGWAYFRMGRFDDAVREMERAVSLKPEDPVLNDHLGDAYWRVGRKLEATYQWTQARDLKPDPDVLATLQQKLLKGLPPIESNTAQETPKVKPEPTPAPKG
ncbi:tetratricopeptide repeat protein [Mesorhizobium sp. CA18]|uniref:tetratricopeptide repeat protein n=1 Tax=unclassified Mesorhizobium TaxID=325217 RepID=UPI001CCBA046|nr:MULTISPECIES: tetratricopeptide repeat protein [unclassified Mesorhizobium]MBZ9733190.1 tetratricopeptide repeat protein [Mesorhizobium sp. CA9]MBZ9826022.1 tetratricopeptide repeat protein [Mesorhizobium sp. CA18]MBZ9831025.1 tetratricopeptide repeat protein [Mesorhizobium sp. CA2]MBZ9835300.1 tetratricopeptide repeat protein [Mesorhizobium sp. CA3]MBZ9876016.1 tetratricopeptide repeat protein [Mesorhizobium sp. Ca11]